MQLANPIQPSGVVKNAHQSGYKLPLMMAGDGIFGLPGDSSVDMYRLHRSGHGKQFPDLIWLPLIAPHLRSRLKIDEVLN